MPYIPCARCQFLMARWGVVAFCPACARQAHYAVAYFKARRSRMRPRHDRVAAPAAAERPRTLHDFDDQTLIGLCRLRARIREGAYADDRTPAGYRR